MFLRARAAQPKLPGTLMALLDEIGKRARQLADLGQVRLIECAEPALADEGCRWSVLTGARSASSRAHECRQLAGPKTRTSDRRN